MVPTGCTHQYFRYKHPPPPRPPRGLSQNWIYRMIEKLRRKWNESGFRPPMCTHRLNWARITSWGWWDDWDDTVLQTQDSNSSPGGLKPSTLTLGHGGSPQYWLSHVDGEETFFVSLKPPSPGTEPRALAWKAAVLTTTLGPPPSYAETAPGSMYSHIVVSVFTLTAYMGVLELGVGVT